MNFRPDWQQLNRRISRTARGGANRSALRPLSAQALVEFMLVSIPLLATMFAIMEFGITFWDLQQLAQVTRDAARQTGNCNNQCDAAPPLEANAPDAGLYYKDMRALQAVADRDPNQRNGTRLLAQNIDYILIRRIADTTSAGGGDDFIINQPTGKVDISGQYQVYVPDTSAGKYLPFRDATFAEATTLASVVGLPAPTQVGGQWYNASYVSTPCAGTQSGTSGYYRDDQKQASKASGFDFYCQFDTSKQPNTPGNWTRGRPLCQPADRFYVEIAYRHYWITPFFPEFGVTVSRPKNDNGFVVLKQRVYLKVEPVYFPLTNGVCPTGV